MNKINLHKLVNKDDIEQSFYEGDEDGILRTKTESVGRCLTRTFTGKSKVSVDVENINKYFMKEYHIESDLKQIAEMKESFVEVDLTNLTTKPEELYYLTSNINYKSIFEEFITIGIEPYGLEYTDLEELYLTPKVLANYPNNLEESEIRL
jgi:hypothetical protein